MGLLKNGLGLTGTIFILVSCGNPWGKACKEEEKIAHESYFYMKVTKKYIYQHDFYIEGVSPHGFYKVNYECSMDLIDLIKEGDTMLKVKNIDTAFLIKPNGKKYIIVWDCDWGGHVIDSL